MSMMAERLREPQLSHPRVQFVIVCTIELLMVIKSYHASASGTSNGRYGEKYRSISIS